MNSVREIDISNDDKINIKSLNPNKIKIDEKSYKNILIYYIGYVTSNSLRPLCLIINKIKGCI